MDVFKNPSEQEHVRLFWFSSLWKDQGPKLLTMAQSETSLLQILAMYIMCDLTKRFGGSPEKFQRYLQYFICFLLSTLTHIWLPMCVKTVLKIILKAKDSMLECWIMQPGLMLPIPTIEWYQLSLVSLLYKHLFPLPKNVWHVRKSDW